jgi:hypothetical protein
MTAEPQIGYPGPNAGWQQTPAGSDADGPSGLSHAFAGYGQPALAPDQAPSPLSFAGHDPGAPSGLSFAAPAFPSEPTYPPADVMQAPETYPDPAYPQAAYPDAAYSPATYPDAAYAAPSQAAYPSPAPPAAYPAAPAGYGPAGNGMPGYLQPYGPPARPSGKGPGIGPVIGFTFFFGPFGAISAARRAERARTVGDRTGKYWIAFGATLVGCWVLIAILAILVFAMSVAADGTSSKTTTAVELQQSIVQQGTFTDAAGKTLKVRTATCAAQALAPNGNGVGTYTCALGLADGTKDTVLVSLDSNGRWRVIGQAK